MANTATDNNTQTCTIGTDHSLYNGSAEGNYVLHLDFVNAAAGDTFEVSVLENGVRSGGTKRLVEVFYFYGPQSPIIWLSPPYDVVYGIEFKLKQVEGTGRDVPWSVRELG